MDLRKSFSLIIFLFTLPVLYAIGTLYYSPLTKTKPIIKNGTLDLKDWNFNKSGIVNLKGEWDFYWNQLLTPLDFVESEPPKSSIQVPGTWNSHELMGENLPGFGYATYRLKIRNINKHNQSLKHYAIRSNLQLTASRIFVNGHLITQLGNVSINPKAHKAHTIPHVGIFSLNSGNIFNGDNDLSSDRSNPNANHIITNHDIEIIIQVSNFSHRKGGILFHLYFGPYQQITAYNDQLRLLDAFILGILLMMSFYHIMLSLIRKIDLAPLLFAAFSITIAFRMITTGEKYLLYYIQDLPYRLYVSIEYLSFFMSAPIGLHFIQIIFPEQLRFFWVKIIYALGLFFSAVVILFPVSIFSYTAIPYLAVLALALFIVLSSLAKAILAKQKYSLLLFLSFLILLLCAINDSLNTMEILQNGYLVHFGLLIFIFSQASIITMRFNEAFITVDNLSNRLALHKEKLEDIVKKRTLKLAKEVEERKYAQKKAEQLARAKEDFMANISHEIRTPMNAIISVSELLEEKLTGQHDLKFLQIFRNAGETLMNILNDLLDLSKMESGNFSIENKKFNLHEIINTCYILFASQFIKKNIEFNINIDGAVPKMMLGDGNRISQILNNLISNALKFTDQGQVDLEIGYQITDSQEKILFTVRDTGIGMDQKQFETLFARFSQADTSTARRFGGTGLGLSICKQLIGLMGGEIFLHSMPNQGTTVNFYIPYHNLPLTEINSRNIIKTQPLSVSGKSLRILVVDDNEDNLFLVKKMLQGQKNWTIDLVSDGEKALDLFERKDFDIVLLDIQMPIMDGYDVFDKMIVLPNFDKNKVKIIAFTAHHTQEEKQRLLRHGFDLHLGKPVRKQFLIDSIRDLVS